MFILRILVAIVAIPFIILAFILRLFFRAFVFIGGKIIWVISGLALLGGIFVIVVELFGTKENIWSGVWMIVGSIGGFALPYLAAILSELCGGAIEWLKNVAFGSWDY